MDAGTANQLALRILAHWDLPPTAERVRTWTDLLAELDEGRAGTAFARSRALDSMTPAAFAKAYKALRPAPPAYTAQAPTGDELTFPQYLARLVANRTSTAIEELERWHRAAEAGLLGHKMVEQLKAATI